MLLIPDVSQIDKMSWNCAALIFDLDGVLIDSNATSERHWKIWAQKHGVPFEQILAIHHGRPTAEIIRCVAPQLDAAQEASLKEDREADDLDGLSVFPGAARLLGGLPESRRAIVTSGKRRTAMIRLNFGNLPIPQTFITANEIQNGKPHPEPYLKAIDRLGFSAGDCVVVEDAPAGIAAARAAGARVIAVATSNGPEELGQADVILRRLDDIQLSVSDAGLSLSWSPAAELKAGASVDACDS